MCRNQQILLSPLNMHKYCTIPLTLYLYYAGVFAIYFC